VAEGLWQGLSDETEFAAEACHGQFSWGFSIARRKDAQEEDGFPMIERHLGTVSRPVQAKSVKRVGIFGTGFIRVSRAQVLLSS
jgi:hypothetical protein